MFPLAFDPTNGRHGKVAKAAKAAKAAVAVSPGLQRLILGGRLIVFKTCRQNKADSKPLTNILLTSSLNSLLNKDVLPPPLLIL